MIFSNVTLAVVMFMQAANPLLGTFLPMQTASVGAATIGGDSISFANGVVLDTTLESGGAFQGVAAVGVVEGSASLPSTGPDSFSGYMELRRIERHTGDARDLRWASSNARRPHGVS